MSLIKVMPELLANKIAAGEVVEKCASVVKELVENSIDAKSTNIKINLLDGGIKGITVIDNGKGMDKEDAVLSFSRHATSKIYKDDDLFFIETLGFRGEALASIASVSEVILETCASDIGTLVHIKGGKLLVVTSSSSRKGTSVSITNLFYNTPARLKYLKSEQTELNNCVEFIEHLALSVPSVSFTLTNNEKTLVKTSGSNLLHKTIHEIYGLNVSSNMLKLDVSSDDFEISGYISKPSILKSNRNHLITIVNSRVVKNYELNKAINDAYNTYKPDGKYPIVVINIETDPTLIDVNIHPTKQDIKFSKITSLTDILYIGIKNVLYNTLLVPNALYESIYDDTKTEYISEEVYNYNQESFDFTSTNEDNSITKNEEFKKLKLYPVGVVHGTYIIAENEDGMYIIDQHAAHERINYELVLKKLANETTNIINLLIPLSIELTKSDYLAFQEQKYILEDLGFIIEEFGTNTVLFKAHPSWLKDNFEEDNIRTIVDLVISNKKNFNKETFLDSLAKMMACKMSIKANMRKSTIELEQLLNDLVKCDNPYNCCHGRPLIIKYSNYDLEKLFKRVM
ncbi:MAG: DNA mismatch repair endonuclease MutL [Bacilli bacterium]